MDKSYWNNYYESNSDPFLNSQFSKFVLSKLVKQKSIIDIGCGNGRDSIFFAKNEIYTYGIDQSEIAINNLKKYENKFLEFQNTSIENLPNKCFDYGYCRFLLHSINKKTESNLVKYLNENIRKLIFIETRVLDKENNFDSLKMNHYRRIEGANYYNNLFAESSFKVIYEKMSYKFAKYKKTYNVKDIVHDPLVLRLILKRESKF